MGNQFIQNTALISSDPHVIEQVQSCFTANESLEIISTAHDVELISIELPELIILDYTDWELAFTVLDRIISDPWIHYQSVLSICTSSEVTHRIGGHRGINLIAAIARINIHNDIPVVLDILRKNRQLLFHRGYETTLFEKVFGTYSIQNSLLEIEVLINLICGYLFNANKIDTSRKNRLKTALTELMVNALEHGNCEIGFTEKSQWLASGKHISELITEKLTVPARASREIRLTYEMYRDYSNFIIADDGMGFDWRFYLTSEGAPKDYTTVSGRGIIMARASSARLEYNDTGNEVTCSIDHKELSSNHCPAVFAHLPVEHILEGTTVLRQGDTSNYLYFISRGRYMVTIDERPISILTPDDIFMGEMSFLLNGKRNATITALSDGEVIRISKREFISVLRDYSYYTLFLARLLAQRLHRSNN